MWAAAINGKLFLCSAVSLDPFSFHVSFGVLFHTLKMSANSIDKVQLVFSCSYVKQLT